MWVKTEDQLPPEDELVLGDDGSGILLCSLSGDRWTYSGYESKVGPIYWCKIPERRKD